MSITRVFCRQPKPTYRALWWVFMAVLSVAVSPQTTAQDDPPLIWFNYFFDTTTTLAYGVPASDYVPLFFECERANPMVSVHIEHEPVRVRDGENTDVHLSSAGGDAHLSGTALYQVMDDLMRIEARMAVDQSLERMLASDGVLTTTIEGTTVIYSLRGISEPAAALLEACLAASPDEPPPTVTNTSGAPAGDAEKADAEGALAVLHAVTEIDLMPIARARPELIAGDAPQISAVQASPDGAMLALLLPSRDIDFPDQAWLYQRADHTLVPATPQPALTSPPYPDGTPAAIQALVWEGDTLYTRLAVWTRDGEGAENNTVVYAATVDGRRRLDTVPEDIHALLDDAGEPGVVGQDEVPESDWEILGAIESSAQVLVWPYDVGHGEFELRWRQRLAGSLVHVAARGGPQLSQFVFDRPRSRLFYPHASGIRILDMNARAELAIAGTQPGDLPLALSDDGGVFVWSTRHHCADELHAQRDHANAQSPGTGAASTGPAASAHPTASRRLCVAQISVSTPAAPGAGADTRAIDPWPGAWSADHMGRTSAKIRRGVAKPEYLVIDLVTGTPGCSGAVTLYGQPDGPSVHAESYDAKDPRAPVCTMNLMLDSDSVLHVEETGDCGYFRGGSCVFDGELIRETDVGQDRFNSPFQHPPVHIE